jgi:hypothetical protein
MSLFIRSLPSSRCLKLTIRPTIGMAFLALLTAFASGCGVFIGNVRPEDSKSDAYGISDLTKESSDWVKLDPKKSNGEEPYDPNTTPTEVSDVAYQSKKTSSVISINSACRANREAPANKTIDQDLRDLTDILLLGGSEVTLRNENHVLLQGTPALETTILGKINQEKVQIRAVVLRRRTCIYDLLYVSRPEVFTLNELAFTHFVASLRLK